MFMNAKSGKFLKCLDKENIYSYLDVLLNDRLQYLLLISSFFNSFRPTILYSLWNYATPVTMLLI